MLGRDGGQKPGGALDDRGEPRPRALDLLGERALVARQRVVGQQRPLDRGRAHVVLQAVGGDRRLQLQRGLQKGGTGLVETRDRIAQRQSQQPQHAAPSRLPCRRRGVEQRQADRIAGIDQRRIAGHRAALAGQRQRFGKVAEIPLFQTFAFERRRGGGERQLGRIPQLPAQRSQIAARRQFLSRRVHHRDIHQQVGRQVHTVPHGARQRLTEPLVQKDAQRIGQRHVGGGRGFQERRDHLGDRNDPIAPGLRQRLEVMRYLLADHPRHQPG